MTSKVVRRAFKRAIMTLGICMSLGAGIANVAQADETNWLYYSGSPVDSGDTRLTWFIDPFSLKTFGPYRKQIKILREYTGGMQSAMTWGESEVTEIMFDCQETQMKYSSITWYEETQAQGRVTQEYNDLPWHPIEPSAIQLFAEICG